MRSLTDYLRSRPCGYRICFLQQPAGQARWTRSPRSRRWSAPKPVRPVAPGRIERRTHDDLRHGTTTLSAALEGPPAGSSTPASLATATASPRLPQARRQGVPAPAVACRARQRHHPPPRQGPGLAGQQPADPPALSADRCRSYGSASPHRPQGRANGGSSMLPLSRSTTFIAGRPWPVRHSREIDLADKPAVLGRLQADGFWLIDAVDRPVNHLLPGPRRAAITATAPQLVARCRALAPRRG
jgi:hypothetical protein